MKKLLPFSTLRELFFALSHPSLLLRSGLSREQLPENPEAFKVDRLIAGNSVDLSGQFFEILVQVPDEEANHPEQETNKAE